MVPQKKVGSGNRIHQQAKYEPIMFMDETSLLRNHLVQVSRNISRPPATLHFKYQPTSPAMFSFKVFMKQAFDMLGKTEVLGEAEIDEIKYWISDDRIYRFFLTQAIGLVHMILEYLAFRGDWGSFGDIIVALGRNCAIVWLSTSLRRRLPGKTWKFREAFTA